MNGRALDDFIATATADQLQEHLAHMRQVFARTAEPTPTAVTPAPPPDPPASVTVVRFRPKRAPVRRAAPGPLPKHLTGPYLRRLRLYLRITQRQIEQRLGVWRGVLDRIEHDRHLGPQREGQKQTEQRPTRERLLTYYRSIDNAIR